MRGFVIVWLLAFGFLGLMAVGLGSLLGRGAAPAVTPRAGPSSVEALPAPTSEPFTEQAAVDVVAGRLGQTARGEEYRQELRQAARVSYHSPQHWTVRWGAASWTAHGQGRYAEPDNDLARQREAEAIAGP